MRTRRRTRRRAGSPSVHPREQVVDAAVHLGIDRVLVVGRTVAAPAPDAEREQPRAGEDAAEREPPREQVEALVRRRREDALPERGDELGLDLLRIPAL